MPLPSSTSAVSSVSNSGQISIDALISGVKWAASGSATSISYSFPWTTSSTAVFTGPFGSAYSLLNEPNATEHYGLDAVQQAAAQDALQAWASVANITPMLVQEGSGLVGDVRIAFTSASSTASDGGEAWGWAMFPNKTYPSGGDVWISTSVTDTDWSVGSYNYMSLVHEIGHALGLKHPFEDGDLDLAHANRQYSIMAYDDAPNNLYVKIAREGNSYYWQAYNVVPDTPMVNDIAAIQYMYGANTTYKTGNDTYTFDPATPFLHTIWDAGGNDTISVANFSAGSVIDLTPGHYSSIAIASDVRTDIIWSTAPPTPTYYGTNNLGIAYGAIIENAIGGSGNDTLIGNAVANHLKGNGGANVLDGGAGIDTAVYTGRFSDYALVATSSGYTVTLRGNPAQKDTLSSIERMSFADATVTLNVASMADDPLQAQYTALAQKFYVAYFGRPADAAGLAAMVAQFAGAGVPTDTLAFVDAYQSNATVKALIDSFGNSAESAALYHGTNREFVSAIYDNLLGRAPDLDGLNFWTAGVDAGLSRGVAVLNIVAGAEGNKTAQGLIDATLVANRLTVAHNFTSVLDTPAEVAGYAGNAAAATARALLNAVDQNTGILAYETTVLSTVTQMSAAGVAELVGVQHFDSGWIQAA